MTVRTRLMSAFAAFAVLTGLLVLTTRLANRAVERHVSYLVEGTAREIVDAAKMLRLSLDVTLLMAELKVDAYIAEGRLDPAASQEMSADLASLLDKHEQIRRAYENSRAATHRSIALAMRFGDAERVRQERDEIARWLNALGRAIDDQAALLEAFINHYAGGEFAAAESAWRELVAHQRQTAIPLIAELYEDGNSEFFEEAEEIKGALSSSNRRQTALGVVIVGLGWLVTFLIARRLARSLSRVRGAAERFAAGDLDARVGLMPSDEIGLVGRSLDQMAMELQAAQGRADRAQRDRLAAEAWAHEREQQVARLNRLSTMGEIASSLAHDLNQPIAATLAYVQAGRRLMPDDGPGSAAAKEALDKAAVQAKRAGQIVNGVRDFMDTGAPAATVFPVADVAEGVLRILEGEASAAGVTVCLARSGSDALVYADAVQVEQVTVNLVRNAIQAVAEASDSGDRIVVRIDTVDAARVAVDVVDEGPGWAGDRLDDVFTAFCTTKARGMGMGLAISRSIVEANGGQLTVRRNPQRGLTFRFTLPGAEAMSVEVA